MFSKLKTGLSRLKARVKKTHYEAKERKRLEIQARQIEERHRFNKLIEKYQKQGFDIHEATILARRDFVREKAKARSDKINKIIAPFRSFGLGYGGGQSGKKGGRHKKRNKKGKKRGKKGGKKK